MLTPLFVALALLFASPTWAQQQFPDCVNGPLANTTVCDTSATPTARAKALVAMFTTAEMISNTDNGTPGVPRLGLPPYQWWSEALHGVAGSPGVFFASSGNFSSATSFPGPILMSAAFDDELIKEVATVVSTEARAFDNAGRAGLDFFTPNINPFRDPRWGRGQETPGEDPFRGAQYVFNLIQGLQGGIDPATFKIVADCKHWAGYDLENWEGNSRHSFNAVISQQDLSEYYLPSFQSCVRDAKVGSVMCSYNAVNGIPSCANTFLLQTILRDTWGFDQDRWVTSDCDAISDFINHNYVADLPHAAAAGILAGTDVDCGSTYGDNLQAALTMGLLNETDISASLTRLYSSLVRLGYFDPAASQPYRQLGWTDVNTPSAQNLAYQAAVEGLTLLKNDGTLPLSKSIKKLALIGPWANATTSMQGNYAGVAPFLISPLMAAQSAGFSATYSEGTTIDTTDTSGFAAAVTAAQAADAIIFLGGIDNSVEAEGNDRTAIAWTGNQLDLVSQLSALSKPLVVVQFGGGQVDDAALKNNSAVNSILWAGYPGQSGGTAILDVLKGKVSPAGRLVTTQYPADYVNEVPMTDMSLRVSSSNPGRTYKWYSGVPTFEFGTGLSFTSFALNFAPGTTTTYSIQSLVANGKSAAHLDLAAFDTFSVSVHNSGKVASDFVSLLFVKTTNAGPAPFPNKVLVSYARTKGIAPGQSVTARLAVTLGSIARVGTDGSAWLYPGDYSLLLDVPTAVTHNFRLTGSAAQITHFPVDTESS
ncbi:glycoside hydrolase family 3 protein [Roridomyces roridus]|uniref:xylan 1,4-beta-xylosidase n=1 Tax=Roridomyces roridus TaxID=1738132 RepID=A0AAD7CBA4_9AGAR|nr:glycoside hydrolase family 3 protein [Roridomyces roridus]